ncbi:MAG TPA: hypothetical protein VFS67_26235 [Polyangiaceae bacterium]|nr:hypothetical protein [Polyangiaceae bacterium]
MTRKIVWMALLTCAQGGALLGELGCGEGSSSGVTAGSGGGAGAGTGAAGAGGNNSAGSGGSAGGGTSAGAGGAAGAGQAPLDVPRVETSEGGPSVLDTPQMGLNADGRCQGLAVYCNGSCLGSVGASAGNCSLLALGLGQTSSVAVSADALYYTAANAEILRMPLPGGAPSSLARGLTFPTTLRVIDGELYFSAAAPGRFPLRAEVKRMAPAGGEWTVLSQDFNASEIGFIEPAGDQLLFGSGAANSGVYEIPRSGGRAERLGTVNTEGVIAAGGKVYFNQDGYVSVLSLDAPGSETKLNQTSIHSRILLEGDYLYALDHGAYLRIPVAGGEAQEVQAIEAANDAGVSEEPYLLGRMQRHALVVQDSVADATLTQLSSLPIAGGTLTRLVTLERSEYRAHAADATSLYVAMGQSHGGGILKITLP